MHISARADYALRALLTLAADGAGARRSCDSLATAQGLPVKFLESILSQLRRGQLLVSMRGADGGYRLARPAAQISVAEVIRVVDGPLAEVRGLRPEHTSYDGAATNLQHVWIGLRAALRSVLEAVSLDDVLAGRMPPAVAELVDSTDAWHSH